LPTVPTYDTPQVAPEGLPNVQIQGLSPRQLAQGEIAGQQQEAAGQAVQNIGVQGLDADAHANMMANQVRVDAALNDVRATQQKLTYDPTSGYLSQTGAAAVQPNAQGQGLADQYGQKMSDAISTASGNLANDAQRQVFARSAAQLQTQFSGEVQRHALQENTSLGVQTQAATIDMASDTARRNWYDPNAISADPKDQANSVIQQNIDSAKAAVWKSGQLTGDPATMTAVKMQQVESQIHSSVILSALQNNRTDYAQSYLQKFAPDMTAGDLLKSQLLVKNDVDSRAAAGAAQNAITQFSPSLFPSPLDRMSQITKQSESGGQGLKADGTPVTSATGAKYAMQVQPDTAANPGHGIPPAASDTPAEYNRVGTQLLGALIKKYSGDTAKAWAAYNAGEGNVDKAIADASGGAPGGTAQTNSGAPAWMQALAKYQTPENHAQTLAYVYKNVSQLGAGGGIPPLPTLGDIQNNIRTALGPNADPMVLSKALAEGSRQYSDALKSRSEQADQVFSQSQQYLAQNHGDMTSLPPELHASLIALAPGKLPELQTFANSMANPPKADNMLSYHEAFDRPDLLAKMTDPQFAQFAMTNFSEATQKQLGTIRQNAINGKIDTGPASINEPVFTRELNNRMQSIGLLNDKGKPNDLDQAGTISNYLRTGALAQQQQTGQKMSEAQLIQYVDGQFLKSTELPGMLWGSTTKPTLSMTTSDIPGDQLDQVKASLAKQGNTSPSNDQIMRTYWAATNTGRMMPSSPTLGVHSPAPNQIAPPVAPPAPVAPSPAPVPASQPPAAAPAPPPDDSPTAAFARSQARMAAIRKARDDADAAEAEANSGTWVQASTGATANWVPKHPKK
jgi:soluble lytic murein transglycosylase